MLFCILMLISGSLLWIAPRLLPGFADRYAEVMNPLILNTLGRLTGLLPFSLAEFLLLALIPVLVFSFRKRVFRKTLACILCAMFFLFQMNEGVYFSRTRFADATKNWRRSAVFSRRRSTPGRPGSPGTVTVSCGPTRASGSGSARPCSPWETAGPIFPASARGQNLFASHSS